MGEYSSFSDQDAALAELVQQLLVVDVEAEGLGGGIEVGAVDEQRDAVGGVKGHLFKSFE
jgi:hypothetical protein